MKRRLLRFLLGGLAAVVVLLLLVVAIVYSYFMGGDTGLDQLREAAEPSAEQVRMIMRPAESKLVEQEPQATAFPTQSDYFEDRTIESLALKRDCPEDPLPSTQIERAYLRLDKSATAEEIAVPYFGGFINLDENQIRTSIIQQQPHGAEPHMATNDCGPVDERFLAALDALEQIAFDPALLEIPFDDVPLNGMRLRYELECALQWNMVRAHLRGDRDHLLRLLDRQLELMVFFRRLDGGQSFAREPLNLALFLKELADAGAVGEEELAEVQDFLLRNELTEEESDILDRAAVLRAGKQLKRKEEYLRVRGNILDDTTGGMPSKFLWSFFTPLYDQTVDRMTAASLRGDLRTVEEQHTFLQGIAELMNSSGYHTYPYMYVMGRTGDPQVLELFPYLSNIRWSVNGQSQYARFVIAATRFHLKHGRWPADVSELCPEFLECEFEEQTGRRWSVQMVAPFDYPDLRGASVGDAFNIRHIIDKEQRVPSSPEELQKLASRYGFGDISQVPFASFVPRPLFIEVYTTASFRDEAGEQVIVNVYQPPSAERLEQYRKFSSAGPSMATVHLTWNNEADMIGRMSELLSPQEEPHGKE